MFWLDFLYFCLYFQNLCRFFIVLLYFQIFSDFFIFSEFLLDLLIFCHTFWILLLFKIFVNTLVVPMRTTSPTVSMASISVSAGTAAMSFLQCSLHPSGIGTMLLGLEVITWNTELLNSSLTKNLLGKPALAPRLLKMKI